MFSRQITFFSSKKMNLGTKKFSKSSWIQAEINSKMQDNKKESTRMQEFHEKLKKEPFPADVDRSMRFIDLVLVETDPKSGEIISNSEKEPTKWGDWQHGGRVTDF